MRERNEWDDLSDGSSSSDGEPEPPTGQGASEMLIEQLLTSHLRGDISAKTLCLTCYWAARAGAADPIGMFGFPPGAQSGAYQRHVDRVLGYRAGQEGDRYTLKLPQYLRHEAQRTVKEVPAMAPHQLRRTRSEAQH